MASVIHHDYDRLRDNYRKYTTSQSLTFEEMQQLERDLINMFLEAPAALQVSRRQVVNHLGQIMDIVDWMKAGQKLSRNNE